MRNLPKIIPKGIVRFFRNKDVAVSLICVSMTAISALSSLFLTSAFILPKDTLTEFVPAEATTYLHADLTSLSNNLHPDSLLMVPGGIRADEAARFTLFIDGEAETGWLIAWHWGQPSVSESETLSVQNAVRLNDRTWLLGSQRLNEACRKAIETGDVLKGIRNANEALDRARKLSGLQFMFNPTNLPQETLPEWMAGLPPIAGSSRDLNMEYATIFPVGEKATEFRSGESNLPIYWLTGTEMAYAGSSDTINWMPIIFGSINDWRIKAGLDPADLPDSRQIHDGPISITAFLPYNDPLSRSISLRLHGANIDQIAENIEVFLNNILPTRTVTLLPDGDEVVEFMTGQNNVTFRSSDDGNSMALSDRATGLRLHVRQDGDSVILSTEAIEPSFVAKNALNYGGCERIAGNQVITRGEVLNNLWEMIGFKPYSKEEFSLFIENNENLWITCRLIPKTVDK